MFVTNIQRFSLDDGPGIRTTIFLAGCNMRCLWCHNPENFEKIMLGYDREKCTQCRRCQQVCQNDVHIFKNNEHQIQREKCVKCWKCAGVCDNEALFKSSRELSKTELLAEIEKDRHFYNRSQGGVTFSGGEPVLWSKELGEILAECKNAGIHTAIETAGNYSFDLLEPLLDDADLIIMDCKTYSDEPHRRFTGQSNRKILSNIQKLSDIGKTMWVRIPVIWGVNITSGEMQRIAEFLEGKSVEKVELIPYHKMGIGKYRLYGQAYAISDAAPPTEEQMEECRRILRNYHVGI